MPYRRIDVQVYNSELMINIIHNYNTYQSE